jgi:hypothetical protein
MPPGRRARVALLPLQPQEDSIMSLDLTTKTTTTTTRRHRVEIDNTDLIQLLTNLTTANLADVSIPPDGARIYISIPGGGDWSSTDLDIDKDNPIVIEWEEEEVTQS